MGAIWWKGILVRKLNTCEESHRTNRIVWASMKEDSWMSCSGQPGRYQKTPRI